MLQEVDGLVWSVVRSWARYRRMFVRISAVIGLLTLALGCGDGNSIDEACRSNADCAETEICATGICEGGVGICNERPTSCPDTDSPVCGCDGVTYQNTCFATMAGIRIAITLPCAEM
jgi:hypothetical protein